MSRPVAVTPIPEEAQPIAALIRQFAPRPDPASVRLTSLGSIRFVGTLGKEPFRCCPAGLLPFCTSIEPTDLDDFEADAIDRHAITYEALAAFFLWWDWQPGSEAEAAIAALWGAA